MDFCEKSNHYISNNEQYVFKRVNQTDNPGLSKWQISHWKETGERFNSFFDCDTVTFGAG